MRTLDVKLVRELLRHWVQVTSIALVMACGTMTIMGLRSTLVSVRAAKFRFAELTTYGMTLKLRGVFRFSPRSSPADDRRPSA